MGLEGGFAVLCFYQDFRSKQTGFAPEWDSPVLSPFLASHSSAASSFPQALRQQSRSEKQFRKAVPTLTQGRKRCEGKIPSHSDKKS